LQSQNLPWSNNPDPPYTAGFYHDTIPVEEKEHELNYANEANTDKIPTILA
jgi:hypothetical protein